MRLVRTLQTERCTVVMEKHDTCLVKDLYAGHQQLDNGCYGCHQLACLLQMLTCLRLNFLFIGLHHRFKNGCSCVILLPCQFITEQSVVDLESQSSEKHAQIKERARSEWNPTCSATNDSLPQTQAIVARTSLTEKK